MGRQRIRPHSTGADSRSSSPEQGPAISDPSTVAALLQLADQTGTDELESIINSLREQGEHCVSVIRGSLPAGDSAAITVVTHGLTGSAGALGASILESICRRICDGARHGDLAAAAELVEQLQHELGRALQELTAQHHRWRERLEPAQEPTSE